MKSDNLPFFDEVLRDKLNAFAAGRRHVKVLAYRTLLSGHWLSIRTETTENTLGRICYQAWDKNPIRADAVCEKALKKFGGIYLSDWGTIVFMQKIRWWKIEARVVVALVTFADLGLDALEKYVHMARDADEFCMFAALLRHNPTLTPV